MFHLSFQSAEDAESDRIEAERLRRWSHNQACANQTRRLTKREVIPAGVYLMALALFVITSACIALVR